MKKSERVTKKKIKRALRFMRQRIQRNCSMTRRREFFVHELQILKVGIMLTHPHWRLS